MSEQDLIKNYFSRHNATCESVELSVGDDAAILNTEPNSKLVVTTDTLNVNQHFFEDHPADALGHKSLAVSLSDIAAMGAVPLWATLSLSISHVDHKWLEAFSNGLYKLTDKHNVKIVGGDLVKGPLSITFQVIGKLETKPTLRDACEEDDLIYVTGCLGDSAFGFNLRSTTDLEIDKSDREYFLNKWYRPDARLDAAKYIINYSKAAIDLSDGLLKDLDRMLASSKKGAILNLEQIPVSEPMKKYLNNIVEIESVLTGGEDYQLLFTINPKYQQEMEQVLDSHHIQITQIGKIVKGNNIQLLNSGKLVDLPEKQGFDHFA